jgi:hypothetical protein
MLIMSEEDGSACLGALANQVVTLDDPGSPEALQLLDLLYSLLKAINSTSQLHSAVNRRNWVAAVSDAAVQVGDMVLSQGQRPLSMSQGAASSGGSAAVVLPWLVLLGRCAAAAVKAAQTGPTLQPSFRADSSLLQSLTDGLQADGRVLTSFAVPHCCNNPACVSITGPSEAQLVNGRGNLCGGCRVARYCSRSCLRQHWGQHKPVCKALAAAAAATTAAAAAQADRAANSAA